MMVFGPPMEQMFFSRAPSQTGTVDTAKSWTHVGVNGYQAYWKLLEVSKQVCFVITSVTNNIKIGFSHIPVTDASTPIDS